MAGPKTRYEPTHSPAGYLNYHIATPHDPADLIALWSDGLFSPVASKLPQLVGSCNMDTCSGSCIHSGAMDFICLSYDYFALLDLISCPELFSDSGSQYYV